MEFGIPDRGDHVWETSYYKVTVRYNEAFKEDIGSGNAKSKTGYEEHFKEKNNKMLQSHYLKVIKSFKIQQNHFLWSILVIFWHWKYACEKAWDHEKTDCFAFCSKALKTREWWKTLPHFKNLPLLIFGFWVNRHRQRKEGRHSSTNLVLHYNLWTWFVSCFFEESFRNFSSLQRFSPIDWFTKFYKEQGHEAQTAVVSGVFL